MPHAVFNQRLSMHYDLELRCNGSGFTGSHSLGGSARPLGEITGIYARMMDPDALPELRATPRSLPDQESVAKARAVCALFDEVMEVLAVPVVNRPSCMGSNLSKPAQAQAIVRAGLLTPPTLITNVPDAVRAFHADHRRIVYKSISAARSIVREWTPEAGPDIAAVAHLPTQFQAFIPGQNVRVHVIGEQVFATAIDSDAVDYRYAGRDDAEVHMQPLQLPTFVAEACSRVTSDLGLTLSGIDLKRTQTDEWYCFEVNPSPAYSFFEELGGQPIAAALVQLLSGRA
ncbi:MAG TPA: hypothetical protein VIV63_16870 [Steroidobacteraceae bacterium]